MDRRVLLTSLMAFFAMVITLAPQGLAYHSGSYSYEEYEKTIETYQICETLDALTVPEPKVNLLNTILLDTELPGNLCLEIEVFARVICFYHGDAVCYANLYFDSEAWSPTKLPGELEVKSASCDWGLNPPAESSLGDPTDLVDWTGQFVQKRGAGCQVDGIFWLQHMISHDGYGVACSGMYPEAPAFPMLVETRTNPLDFQELPSSIVVEIRIGSTWICSDGAFSAGVEFTRRS